MINHQVCVNYQVPEHNVFARDSKVFAIIMGDSVNYQISKNAKNIVFTRVLDVFSSPKLTKMMTETLKNGASKSSAFFSDFFPARASIRAPFWSQNAPRAGQNPPFGGQKRVQVVKNEVVIAPFYPLETDSPIESIKSRLREASRGSKMGSGPLFCTTFRDFFPESCFSLGRCASENPP